MTDRMDGQSADGSAGGRDGAAASGLELALELAMLEAIETPDDAAFDRFVRTLADPAVGARLVAMRADRALLGSMPVGAVPDGLLAGALDGVGFGVGDGVGDEISTDVLARLGEGRASIEGLPVSRVEPYREPVFGRVWRHRRALGVALAAGLVIAVSIGVSSAVRGWRGTAVDAPAVVAAEDGESGSASSGPRVARGDAPSGVSAGASAEVAPEASAWAGTRLASAIDAAGYLGDARLVVYVRVAGVDGRESAGREGSGRGPGVVGDGVIGGFPAAIGSQRIGPDHSFEVASADLGVDGARLASLGFRTSSEATVASADGGPAGRARVDRGGWVVRVRRSPAALSAFRKRLESEGMAVEFWLLPEAFSAGLDGSVGMTEDAVLWWSNPPASWHRTAIVPVVVDRLVPTPP